MSLCCLWLCSKCGQQIRAYSINAFARPIASDRGKSDLFRYKSATNRPSHSVTYLSVTRTSRDSGLFFLFFPPHVANVCVYFSVFHLDLKRKRADWGCATVIRHISSLIYTAQYHQMALAPSGKRRRVFLHGWSSLKGTDLISVCLSPALNISGKWQGSSFSLHLWVETWKNPLVISI